MKTKPILICAFLSASLWARADNLPTAPNLDDPQWNQLRKKAIESVRKIVNDPATSAKDRDAVSRFELSLLDDDTKQIAETVSHLEKQIDAIAKSQAAVETETRSPITKPLTPQDAPGDSDASTSWHVVTTFSGSSEKNSPPFTITSDRWRVNWQCSASAQSRAIAERANMDPNSSVILSGEVIPEGGSLLDSQSIVAGKIGSGTDTTELSGSGSYKIKAISANCDWTFVVEEYR